MAIARRPVTVLDCPAPDVLARFYADLLGAEITSTDADWWHLREPGGSQLAFQQVDGYVAPDWPGQDVPQQFHLDVLVDDLDETEAAVLALGASKHSHQPGETFRVFLDPAGHPFCLCHA